MSITQAVRDGRHRRDSSARRSAGAEPTIAALRRFVDDLADSTHAIGELMLEVTSAYDTDVLARLSEQIGELLEHSPVARRELSSESGARRPTPNASRLDSTTRGLTAVIYAATDPAASSGGGNTSASSYRL